MITLAGMNNASNVDINMISRSQMKRKVMLERHTRILQTGRDSPRRWQSKMCHLILLMPILALPIFWLMPLNLAIPIYIIIALMSGADLEVQGSYRPDGIFEARSFSEPDSFLQFLPLAE